MIECGGDDDRVLWWLRVSNVAVVECGECDW